MRETRRVALRWLQYFGCTPASTASSPIGCGRQHIRPQIGYQNGVYPGPFVKVRSRPNSRGDQQSKHRRVCNQRSHKTAALHRIQAISEPAERRQDFRWERVCLGSSPGGCRCRCRYRCHYVVRSAGRIGDRHRVLKQISLECCFKVGPWNGAQLGGERQQSGNLGIGN